MEDNNQEIKKSEAVIGYIVVLLVCIAIIVLKSVGVIEWSWWIVLAPVWGALLLIIGAFGYAAILCYSESRNEKKKNKQQEKKQEEGGT